MRPEQVVAFFSGAQEMEEDDMEDFMEAAAGLKPRVRCDSHVLVAYKVRVAQRFRITDQSA